MNLKNSYRHDPGPDPRAVDDAIDSYVTWREESCSVADSYRRWHTANRDDRGRAYRAYLVALDREEEAASAYQRRITQVGSRCHTD